MCWKTFIRKTFKFYFFIYKASIDTKKLTYHQKNRNTILKRSKDYYENNKEQRKLYRRDKYNNMTHAERLKVLAYRREWFHELDLEKKNKMREDSKNRYHSVKVY